MQSVGFSQIAIHWFPFCIGCHCLIIPLFFFSTNYEQQVGTSGNMLEQSITLLLIAFALGLDQSSCSTIRLSQWVEWQAKDTDATRKCHSRFHKGFNIIHHCT